MILQALNRYYGILASDPESDIASPGWSKANVSFELLLSLQGELLNIIHLFEDVQRGKKTVQIPLRMLVPEQIKRSGKTPPANFLCDNSAYVLGLSEKDDPNYASQRFNNFKQLQKDLLANVECPAARAVIAFLDTYEPQTARKNPIITTYLEDLLKGGNLVFKLEGASGYVHEDLEIRRIWEAYKVGAANKYEGQCLVTGETGPIARLHPNLKGIRDANTMGATLVGFNAPAYESYNRSGGQGLNSPVSEKAAFAYTTTLNYLLSPENPNRKFTIGDATVVYWAESQKKEYADLFAGLFMPDENENAESKPETGPSRDKKTEQLLKDVAEKVKNNEKLDTDKLNDVLEGLDPETRFYVLGLAPNAARVSIRFFHSDPFLKIVQKIMAHYTDLQIVREFADQPELIPIWRILAETVSKKATDPKVSPLMAGALLRAILGNTPYPAALYYAIINRVRADVDDPKKGIKKVSYVRAAVIKAYLTRKYRNQNPSKIMEVSYMLNEQSTNQAYLLGRLFAVLEKAQQDAIPGINATITDRYFTSACATPATVFPVLLRLSRHHIAKAEYGKARDRDIEKIMGLLDVENEPFPAHLSLDEQGIFILGYYHQRTAIYTHHQPDAEKLNSNN